VNTFDEREKSLLRAATADILPASVVARKESPYPAIRNPAYEQILRDSLRTVLDNSRSPLRSLVEPARARALTTAGAGSRGFTLVRPTIERAFSTSGSPATRSAWRLVADPGRAAFEGGGTAPGTGSTAVGVIRAY
jgi:asparagine synthetase B (glutamine-hydrolysing)